MVKAVRKYSALTLALTVMLVLALAVPAFAGSFPDTRGHWAEAYIDALVQAGVISGYPDGTFRPNGQVTRAEFATLLVKGLKLQERTPASPSFGDVAPGDWYYTIAETAAAYDIIKGYEGKFWPDNPITREQIVTMLVRALNQASEAESRQNQPLPFNDPGSISSWARGYVNLGKELGLVGGYPDGTFRGNSLATRAEASVMIVKFFQNYGKKVQDPPELQKASYDYKTAELDLAFDEPVKVSSADVTKVGFQFDQGNTVYFLTGDSKVLNSESSAQVLKLKIAGMSPELLSKTKELAVWLKAAAVVDLDGVPNIQCKMAVDFTKPEPKQEEQPNPLPNQPPQDNSGNSGLLGDGLGSTINELTGGVGQLLGGLTQPVGQLLDTTTGLLNGVTGGLPLVGDVLGTAGKVVEPVTGVVGGVTGTVLNVGESLPVTGGVVKNVVGPVLDTVQDLPLLGKLLGADNQNDQNKTTGGLLAPVTNLLSGLL